MVRHCCSITLMIILFHLLASILFYHERIYFNVFNKLCNYRIKAVRFKVEAGVCDERIEIEMTQDDIDSIVELHNELRHRVAYGQEDRGSPGPQPAAFNMPDLVYYITENAVIYFHQHSCIYLGVGWRVGQCRLGMGSELWISTWSKSPRYYYVFADVIHIIKCDLFKM